MQDQAVSGASGGRGVPAPPPPGGAPSPESDPPAGGPARDDGPAKDGGPAQDRRPAPGNGATPGGAGAVAYLWPATATSVARARGKLAEALHAWGMGGLADTAVLVLSELVTNAVRHSRVPGRRVETRFVRTDHGVRLEVHDASAALPRKRRAAEDEESGRGLALVEALTGPECWGFGSREGVGKVVWAQVEPRGAD